MNMRDSGRARGALRVPVGTWPGTVTEAVLQVFIATGRQQMDQGRGGRAHGYNIRNPKVSVPEFAAAPAAQPLVVYPPGGQWSRYEG